MLALTGRRWILLPLLLVLFSNVLVSHATPLVVCTPTASSWSTESFYSYCASRFTVTAAIGANLNDSTIFSSIDTTTGYLDRTTTIDPVTLYRGGTYASAITWGVALGYQEAQVWIDFNDNGIFESSEEVTPVSPYSTTPPPNPTSMAISIPSSAAVGTHLMRMRSIMEVTSTTLDGTPAHLDPCLIQFGSTYPQYYAGDVVDYKVTIQNPPPSLTFSKSSVAFGNVSPGTTSVPPQFLSVSGADLLPSVGTITLSSSSSDFLVSTDGTTWGATVTFTYSGSSFSSKNIYVQFAPGTTTPSAGTISFSGGGLSGAPAVTASGTGNATTCSGMPAAGTAVVSPTSGGGTTVFTLSLTGATLASGLFYQWQSSTSGTTWTNVPDAVYPTCSFMGTGALYYRAIVTCGIGSSATSTVATITPTVASSGCSPTFGNPGASCASYNMYFRISSLTGASGSITDGSGCNGTTNYEDMTSSFSVTLNQGATYDATIQTGYPSYFSGQVWIDFNDDGQFSTTESVGGNGNFTATSEVISLGIPSDAIPGMHRMRVVGDYRGCCGGQEYPTMNPCPNSGIAYGDCRDYKVVIAGNAICSGTPAAGIVSGTPTNGCSGLNATLFNIGETAAGTTFQWQSSASASSGFTNISGATLAVYSPTVASTTYYRNVVTCAASGLSSSTPSLQLAVSAPAGVITGTATVCIGNTTTFSDTAAGGSWSSSNTAVAAVGTDGVVSGISAGTATVSHTVTAACGTAIATRIVTVNGVPSAGTISGIDSMCSGLSTTWSSSITGGTWLSADSYIATVSSAGVVTAVDYAYGGIYEGTNIYYIVSNSCGSDTASKYITLKPHPYIGTIVCPTSLCVGVTATITGSSSPGVWTNDFPSICSMTTTSTSDTIIVTGLAPGIANFYFYAENECSHIFTNRSFSVTATPGIDPISGEFAICAGSETVLSAGAGGSGGTWISANTSVASVDSTGLFTGIGAGTATISYSLSNSCGTGTVTTVVTVNSMTAGPILGTVPVCPGETATLTSATAGGEWYSENEAIATVDVTTGVVTGVATGTVTITYGWLPCGADYATTIVTVNPSGGELSGTTTVCAGSSTTLTSTVTGGVWSSANASVATVGASGIVNGVAAGTAVISYMTSTMCGTAYAIIIVTVNTVPGAATISGTATVCVGDNTTLSSSVGGGTWSSSDASTATISGTGVASGVTAGTAIITYSLTNECGSTNTTKKVTVNAAASAGTISGSANICPGGTTTLSSSVSGGSWSSGNTAVATAGTASGIVTGVATGTSAIAYTTTNSCGSAIITMVVTVNTSPTAGVITGGSVAMCPGGSNSLSSTVSGGTWTSNNAGVASVGSTSGVVTGVAGGIATISYAVNGCSTTAYATKLVTVNAAANAGTITGASSVLVSSSITLSSSAGGGTWSGGNSFATVSGGGVVTGVSAGAVTVSYSVSSSCGTAVATTVVTVNPLVEAIGGATVICSGQATALSNATPGGSWSSNNPTIASISATGVVSGGSPGVAVITYSTSTSGYTTTNITVNALPAPITGIASVCAGSITSLSTATTGGEWGSSSIAIAVVSVTGVVTGINPGTAAVGYTNSSGCARSVVVTVNAQPAITGAANICPGATAALGATVGGGSWSGGSTLTATVNSAGVITGIAAGTANVTYTMSTGCRAVTMATVNAAPATIGGTLKVCPGTATALTNSTAGGSWSSDNTAIATVGMSNGIVTGVAAGMVAMTYATGAGCVRTAIVTVNPSPAAISGATAVCAGTTSALTNSSATLSWVSSNTAVATIGVGTGIVNGVSNGTATITFTASGTGCTATTVVTVNSTPTTIDGPATGCVGSSVALTNSLAGGAWSSNNTAVATVTAGTGVVTGISSGMVYITYSTGAGCYKTKQITINNGPTISGYQTVCAGKTTTLSGGASGTWSSGNTSVATAAISGGYITGIAPGTAAISFTSTSTGCVATTIVTVIAMPGAITGLAQVCSGEGTTLGNTAAGGVWASANTAIATIGSATGALSSVLGSSGNVTISYSFGTGCVVTTTFKVKPAPAVIGGTYSVCATMTTTLSDMTSGGTWSSSNTGVAIVGTGSSAGYGAVTGISAGSANISYTTTLTGCSRFVGVTVDPCSRPGGNEFSQRSIAGGLQLYPNPTTGAFTVVADEAGSLQVYSMEGRQVMSYAIGKGVNNLVLPRELAAAVYMCRYVGESGGTTMVRLVVE